MTITQGDYTLSSSRSPSPSPPRRSSADVIPEFGSASEIAAHDDLVIDLEEPSQEVLVELETGETELLGGAPQQPIVALSPPPQLAVAVAPPVPVAVAVAPPVPVAVAGAPPVPVAVPGAPPVPVVPVAPPPPPVVGAPGAAPIPVHAPAVAPPAGGWILDTLFRGPPNWLRAHCGWASMIGGSGLLAWGIAEAALDSSSGYFASPMSFGTPMALLGGVLLALQYCRPAPPPAAPAPPPAAPAPALDAPC
jgi:hypothetical protein